MDTAREYYPSPVVTSAVVPPADIAVLTERLAEDAHDVWERTRMSER